MNKNIKLLLGASSVAMLSICALQGCSSDSTGTTTPTGGASSVAGATSMAGATSSAGAPAGGGATGTAGAGTAGAATAGASTGGAATAGAGGAATAGAGGAGTGGGAGGAAAGAGGTSGGAGGAAAGAAGGEGTPSANCTMFCSDENTICMFGGGKPYASSAECTSQCMMYTVGDVGVYPAGPTAGNTFACRRWHLSKAGSAADQVTMHCPHTAKTSPTCM